MKNVIVLLVDSTYSKCLSNKKTLESATPFFDSIKDQGLYCENVFSYGPYTNAATKGLYCGNKSLDDFGFYFGINFSKGGNHFEQFSKNGFETYGFYYPYFLIGSDIEKYIDHSIYTCGFVYSSTWFEKFSYFSDKCKKSQLTNEEEELLIGCLELVFDSWLLFYENIEKNEYSEILIRKLRDKDKNNHALLLEEYNNFKKDKIKYMYEVLDKGMKHPLAFINEYDENKICNKQILKEVFAENNRFFRKLEKIDFINNISNSNISIKKCILSLINNIKGKEDKYFRNVLMCLFSTFFTKFFALKTNYKYESSLHSQISSMFDLLDKRDNSKPFYVSLHSEEAHHRISFFTFDTDNKQLISDELKYLKPLLDNFGEKFHGNTNYFLSLRYVDLCLKKMFEGLKKRNMLEDTMVVLTADHGSSFTYLPYRSSLVNNYYTENYQTPLFIWSKDLDIKYKHEFKGLYEAQDVFPTVFRANNLNDFGKYKGINIADNILGRDYVITEYPGGGCPYLIERDLCMTYRDKKYMIAIKCNMFSELRSDNICAIYDLEQDEELNNNLVDSLRNNEIIAKDLGIISARIEEIRKSTMDFLDEQKYTKQIHKS